MDSNLKVIMGISLGASTLAGLSVLLVVPSLYNDIGELQDSVMADMRGFRVSPIFKHLVLFDIRLHVYFLFCISLKVNRGLRSSF